jgi:hypothetical protein
MDSSLAVLAVLGAAAVVGLVLALVLDRIIRRLGTRSAIAADLARRGRRPTRLTAVLASLLVAANATAAQEWTPPLVRVLGLALIAGIAWLIGVSAFVLEDLALSRYRTDVADNRHARRIHTQVTLLRRTTTAVIAVIAIASMLMTFPSVRVAGAGIVASAGVIGIVAGLAAQTSLANVIAGLQLAFTDAIRVDDVVVVEDEWGRIEEITLTYVVVHIWDDRRMILPSTYFTTTPFQNWTRRESAVLGAVELDLDWTIPMDGLRARLREILDETTLWDGRVAVAQVTDAVAGFVRVRVLVSGKDGPTVFDLRCLVRELLVDWLRDNHPAALPRTRLETHRAASALFDGARPLAGARPPDPRRGDDGWAAEPRDARDPLGVPRASSPDAAAAAPQGGSDRQPGGARLWAPSGRGTTTSAPTTTTTTGATDGEGAVEDAARLFGGGPDGDRRSRAFSENPENPRVP